MAFDGCCGQPVHLDGVTDVHRYRQALAAGFDHSVNGFMHIMRVAGKVSGDGLCSRPGVRHRQGTADSAACTGDDGDFAFESVVAGQVAHAKAPSVAG